MFKKVFFNLKIKKNLKNYDFRSYEVNFDRLSKLLDNNNFISLEEGIKEIYKYYKDRKINYKNKIYYNLQIVKSKWK